MTIITTNFLFDIASIAVALLIVGITYVKWRFSYWSRKGLPTLNPQIPYGDAKDLITGKLSFGGQFRDFYNKFKAKGVPHGGVFLGTKPFYIPVDPESIKQVLVKDFHYFNDRAGFHNEEVDPLNENLLNLTDAKWKNMRTKLTPTFTSGKMKMMFQTMVDCGADLKTLMDDAATSHVPLDIKDVLGRFTTDIIGSCAFGLECNSLKDPDAMFRKYGKKIFEVDFWRGIKLLSVLVVPHSILKLFKFKTTPPDVESFFMDVIKKTVDYRERNNIYRKDFLHLLLQLKNRGKVEDDGKLTDEDGSFSEKGLTINELAAQSFIFFGAGFETSSTTTTWALYELGLNPEIQEKVRKNINEVLAKYNGQLTFDGIMEMTYLDQVLNESLRKYPPIPLLPRRCTKNYTIPNTDVVIEKGDNVFISILGLHMDPEYYPNPEKFDPERFSEENKKSIAPSTWIPFGDGPRICIGLRFGLLQSKVALITLLRSYKIKLNKKTKFPMEIDRTSFITAAQGGVWIDVEKLD